MLNENNIMSCFLLNPENAKLTPIRREGIIELAYDNSRINLNKESDKFALDIGYTIDCDAKEITFKIDNKTIAIKTLDGTKELSEATLANNECAIITNNVYFKTIVWLSKELIGKTFYFSILTCNSTLASYDIDYIAKKINKLDIEYFNNAIDRLNNNIESILGKLDILDGDLFQNESKVLSMKEDILNIENMIKVNSKYYDVPNEEDDTNVDLTSL